MCKTVAKVITLDNAQRCEDDNIDKQVTSKQVYKNKTLKWLVGTEKIAVSN